MLLPILGVVGIIVISAIMAKLETKTYNHGRIR